MFYAGDNVNSFDSAYRAGDQSWKDRRDGDFTDGEGADGMPVERPDRPDTPPLLPPTELEEFQEEEERAKHQLPAPATQIDSRTTESPPRADDAPPSAEEAEPAEETESQTGVTRPNKRKR